MSTIYAHSKDCTCMDCTNSDEDVDYHDEMYDSYIEHLKETERRLQSTVMPEGMDVHTRYGSEGPRHDPYSFTEITVVMPGGDEVMYHSGLGEELTVNDERVSFCEDDTRQKFEALVGFPCDQLEWWADAPYRGVPCMACGREGCRGSCVE